MTVAEPVPEPLSTSGGIFSVPTIVPPVSVMVNGALKFPAESGVRDTDPLNVPLPIFVSVAVPVTEMLAPTLPVAFTVNVVLIVAAGAAAPTSSAKAKFENVRFMVF